MQTQARSAKLEQPPAVAAWVEQATIHSERLGVADGALLVVVAWALAVRAAAATKKRDLKSMIGRLFVTGWVNELALKHRRGKMSEKLAFAGMIGVPCSAWDRAWPWPGDVIRLVPRHRTFEHIVVTKIVTRHPGCARVQRTCKCSLMETDVD